MFPSYIGCLVSALKGMIGPPTFDSTVSPPDWVYLVGCWWEGANIILPILKFYPLYVLLLLLPIVSMNKNNFAMGSTLEKESAPADLLLQEQILYFKS